MGSAEVVEELLIGRRFFQRVELLTVQVLHQCVSQHVSVASFADDRRDVIESRSLGSTPAALAHHELVATAAEAAHHHRLEQTYLGDRGGQFVEALVIKGTPWLPRVRRDGVDRYFLEVGAGDWTQGCVGDALGRHAVATPAVFVVTRVGSSSRGSGPGARA